MDFLKHNYRVIIMCSNLSNCSKMCLDARCEIIKLLVLSH